MISENNIINETVDQITKNYRENEVLLSNKGKTLPSRDAIIKILEDLKTVIFPGYYTDEKISHSMMEYFAGSKLTSVYQTLSNQIELALLYMDHTSSREDIALNAQCITAGFFKKLPHVQSLLIKDVDAGFNGDPAAKSKEEIIFSYPGLFAIYVYRIAHILYNKNVPFIPRIMTEYAHSQTGIDINSGAKIGEYFFIDHGTGVVIGETCVIGNNVKIYQGVTLGALSTRSGQALSGVKRHPTIRDNVTIYSGATILGGETVIGEHSVIGGNSFITKSIPPHTKVSIKSPELIIKNPKDVSKETFEI